MLSDYYTLSNAYGSYSVTENYIENLRDAFGGYSSLGVRTTGGNFSGLRSFSAPPPGSHPPPPPGSHPPPPPGSHPPPPSGSHPPPPPGSHPPPPPGSHPYHPRSHFSDTHTFPSWYGPFYRNYYYPYFYNRYVTNRFTFFDSLNDIKNKYPSLPSESDKNIMKEFIINLPTVVPCDLPCRDYVKFFIETYLKNNDLEKIVSNKYELVKFIDELKIDINNRYGYQIRYFENTIGI